MKISKIFLAIAALPFFSSIDCPKGDVPYIPLDNDFLSYVHFPETSYWIYEEAITGQLDSCYIFDNYRFTEDDFPTATSRNEIENISQKLVINKDTVFGHIYSRVINDNVHYEYEHTKKVDGQYIRRSVLLKHRNIGFDIPDSLQTFPTIVVHDTLIVNGQLFTDVVEAFFNQNTQLGYKRIFYAKEIGVIRRDNFDGSSWKLVRFHHPK